MYIYIIIHIRWTTSHDGAILLYFSYQGVPARVQVKDRLAHGVVVPVQGHRFVLIEASGFHEPHEAQLGGTWMFERMENVWVKHQDLDFVRFCIIGPQGKTKRSVQWQMFEFP